MAEVCGMLRRSLRLDLVTWMWVLLLPELKRLPSRAKRREVAGWWWAAVPTVLRLCVLPAVVLIPFVCCWALLMVRGADYLLDEEVGWFAQAYQIGLLLVVLVCVPRGLMLVGQIVTMAAYRCRGRRLVWIELNRLGERCCLECGSAIRGASGELCTNCGATILRCAGDEQAAMLNEEIRRNAGDGSFWGTSLRLWFSMVCLPELKLSSTVEQRESVAKLWRSAVIRHWSGGACFVAALLCGMGVQRLTYGLCAAIASNPTGSRYVDKFYEGLGIAASMLSAAIVVLIIMLGYVWLSRERGRAAVRRALNQAGHSLCEVCGYDLRSLEGRRCPECGAFEVEDVVREVREV